MCDLEIDPPGKTFRFSLYLKLFFLFAKHVKVVYKRDDDNCCPLSIKYGFVPSEEKEERAAVVLET